MKRGRQEQTDNPRHEKKATCPVSETTQLPVELWVYILRFIPRAYIPPVRMTCRTFHQAVGPVQEPYEYSYLYDLLDAPLAFIQWANTQRCMARWDMTAIAAAGAGRLDVLTWDTKGGKERSPCDELAYAAASGGHIHVLDWIFKTSPRVKRYFDRICAKAALAGQIETMRWLRDWGFPSNEEPSPMLPKGMSAGLLAFLDKHITIS